MSSTGIYPQVKQYIDEDTFNADQLDNTLFSIEKLFLEKRSILKKSGDC